MTKEERRKAMPYTSERWDWYWEEFGELDWFIANENGHSIEWRRK